MSSRPLTRNNLNRELKDKTDDQKLRILKDYQFKVKNSGYFTRKASRLADAMKNVNAYYNQPNRSETTHRNTHKNSHKQTVLDEENIILRSQVDKLTAELSKCQLSLQQKTESYNKLVKELDRQEGIATFYMELCQQPPQAPVAEATTTVPSDRINHVDFGNLTHDEQLWYEYDSTSRGPPFYIRMTPAQYKKKELEYNHKIEQIIKLAETPTTLCIPKDSFDLIPEGHKVREQYEEFTYETRDGRQNINIHHVYKRKGAYSCNQAGNDMRAEKIKAVTALAQADNAIISTSDYVYLPVELQDLFEPDKYKGRYGFEEFDQYIKKKV